MPPPPEPHAFLSYTHFDDEFHGGAITKLRKRLEDAVRAVTGRPFRVFQDVDGIEIGKVWQDTLDEKLVQSRFLIPILTPSYFESAGCRDELKKFLKHEQATGRTDLILPIHYLDVWQFRDEDCCRDDALVALMSKRQWRDWRDYADTDPYNPIVQPALKKLAAEIGEAVRKRVVRIAPASGSAGAAVSPPSPAVSTKLWAPGTVFRDIDAPWCPEMVVIPAGEFLMGSPESEAGRYPDEGPQHRVTIRQPFALGRYAVTFEQYGEYCGRTGRDKPEDMGWGRGRRPVINVSWHDAVAYCAWLSDLTGQRYRLPSEAEWEYACRAGTTTPFHTGETISTEQANYDGNYTYGRGRKGEHRKRTTEVGSFAANAFGLFDMHGNVLEWCEDVWHDSYDGAPADGSAWVEGGDPSMRVLRGGSWGDIPEVLRSAFRGGGGPGGRGNSVGFRVSRTLTP